MLGGFRLKIDDCCEALQERRKLERKVADERAITDFGDFLTTFLAKLEEQCEKLKFPFLARVSAGELTASVQVL